MENDPCVRKPGEKIRLAEIDPSATASFGSEHEAQASAHEHTESLVRYHDMLMAHETHGVLILFQGMDTSGKDEAIRDVLSRLDPRGCEFKQFKPLTEKEIRHDYLWRAAVALPARGQIGIFNRSYYEHVVVERVHPEHLARHRLPSYAKENIWEKRFRQINNFEQYLVENGIHVLKFFLHMSRDEQKKRLLERMDSSETQWRFSSDDITERGHWDEYMSAYEDALTSTNTEHAPWYVVPADRRSVACATVASVLAEKLKSLHSEYPEPDEDQSRHIQKARASLEADDA